jgi:hypothetical protein
MTPEIVGDLRARLRITPRPLDELHRAAVAAGSAWSADQVALLLSCLPDVFEADGLWQIEGAASVDPLTQALLTLATSTPVPAAALVSRLPQGVVASAAALCEAARHHPDLELLPGSRIRRR